MQGRVGRVLGQAAAAPGSTWRSRTSRCVVLESRAVGRRREHSAEQQDFRAWSRTGDCCTSTVEQGTYWATHWLHPFVAPTNTDLLLLLLCV